MLVCWSVVLRTMTHASASVTLTRRYSDIRDTAFRTRTVRCYWSFYNISAPLSSAERTNERTNKRAKERRDEGTKRRRNEETTLYLVVPWRALRLWNEGTNVDAGTNVDTLPKPNTTPLQRRLGNHTPLRSSVVCVATVVSIHPQVADFVELFFSHCIACCRCPRVLSRARTRQCELLATM